MPFAYSYRIIQWNDKKGKEDTVMKTKEEAQKRNEKRTELSEEALKQRVAGGYDQSECPKACSKCEACMRCANKTIVHEMSASGLRLYIQCTLNFGRYEDTPAGTNLWA